MGHLALSQDTHLWGHTASTCISFHHTAPRSVLSLQQKGPLDSSSPSSFSLPQDERNHQSISPRQGRCDCSILPPPQGHLRQQPVEPHRVGTYGQRLLSKQGNFNYFCSCARLWQFTFGLKAISFHPPTVILFYPKLVPIAPALIF